MFDVLITAQTWHQDTRGQLIGPEWATDQNTDGSK